MNPTVLATVNQKGGVAKTTSCINIGAAMAREGKKVLLVDTDPQASMTISLGNQQPDQLVPTIADLMTKVMNDVPIAPGEGILHHPEGIDLLPANIALAGTEVSLVNAMSRETILKQVLARNRQDYDCIIIDCMPSLGMLTINALAAADRVIIPVQAHYLSAKGLEQLLQTIAKVRRQMNPKLKIDGILMTMVDGRTNNAKEITALIRETYGGKIKVFETAIPHSVRAAEASLTGKSIFEYAPAARWRRRIVRSRRRCFSLKSSGRKPSLTSYDDIFSTEASRQQEQIQRLALSELHPFKDHPFRVLDDDRMMETVESVKEYGVLVPIIARPMADGGYEIVSGHRRKRACELAGLNEIPAIVRDLDDDEAVIIMVDSNLQRENILPSERAKAYQMKLEAIKHQGERRDLTSDQVGQKLKVAVERVAENAGESKSQVQRFIRLNNLEPPLIDKVDAGKLAFTPAVELSYLKPEEQQWLDTALENTQQTPSLSQAQRMKRESKQGTLSEQGIMEIMTENKQTIPAKGSVVLPQEKLTKYFPRSYTTEQMEKVIFKLLDYWMRKRQMSQER